MRTDHLVTGQELRLRNQAAAACQAARPGRHLRVRPADRRHRRRHAAAAGEDRRAGAGPPPDPRPQRAARGRPGAHRPGRRGAELPGAHGGLRRAHRRLRGRCPRDHVRDLRRPALLLPLRGRLDRPPVAGHLRHPAGPEPDRPGRRTGRLPRRRPAADQHPARHPRGPPERPGLPARRGPGQVRLRPGPPRSVHAARLRPPGRVRGRARPRLVRHRVAAAAGSRPPQRGLHRRDGRHLPPPAGAHRRRARRRPARPDVTVRPGKGHGRGQGPVREVRMTPAHSSAHLPSPPPSVAVIGGGLAGITAAIALAEAGAAVTLLEARPRLGGATCSFNRDGLTVDTGQHIFLGCCTAYRDLLGKLGMTEHAPIQDRFDVRVLAPAATPRQGPSLGRLRRTALPGPLHMLPALGRYPFLSLSERAKVARPALAMRFVDPARPGVDEQRFGDWLAARGQTERSRRALWDLFSVSALNIAGDDASLSLAAFVVKTGLLGKNNAADIGVPALPLGELHGDAGATHLTKLGAQVLLNAKVSAIEPTISTDPTSPTDPASPTVSSRPAFRVRLARPADPADDASASSDEAAATDLVVDAVVLAVPHEAAARLIPPGALPEATVAGWAGLGASPIVNVHVIYDRPVMDQPFVAAVDSPVQWVFDRTSISGLDRLSAPAPASPEGAPASPNGDETAVSAPSSVVKPRFHSADDVTDAAGGASGASGADGAGRPQDRK